MSTFLLLGAIVAAQDSRPVSGTGGRTYRWESGWGVWQKDPIGNTHGCVAVASDGRIFFNTDTEAAIRWTDAAGVLDGNMGKDYRDGLHGMVIVKDAGEERLLLTHTGRRDVSMMTLDGKVLWTLGWPKESGKYAKMEEYVPTSAVMAPDGSLFVADGYGKSLVHKFDKNRKWVASFGQDGKETERLKTPHGLFMDVVGGTARLIVCDRENHRLIRYDLDGKILETSTEGLRRPCNLVRDGDVYVVADLVGRVTVLDAATMKPIAQLFDEADSALRAQNGIPRTSWKDGAFISPHGIGVAQDGTLYVSEWLSTGRVVKLVRRSGGS